MNKKLKEMMLRKRNMVVLPEGSLANKATLGIGYIGAVMKDIEQLGFTLDEELIDRIKTLSAPEVVQFHKELVTMLRKAVGAHVHYRPMYPGFPRQVMEADDAELFINAIIHYLSGGKILPNYSEEELSVRFPLVYSGKAKVLHLSKDGAEKEILSNLLVSKTSLSDLDKEDINWFVGNMGENILEYLPEVIPLKENVGFVCSLLLDNVDGAEEIILKYFKTSTDVLRFAVSLSGGDISLAENTYFKKFKRKERRLLLSMLENAGNIEEDMLKYKNRWIRLGEKLHPGEYSGRFPKTAEAFNKLRNNIKIETFNSKVEKAFKDDDIKSALTLLKTRPGNFARSLDRLIRVATDKELVIRQFALVSKEVSTPVLLQVREHFVNRNVSNDSRVFLPKGGKAKAFVIENKLENIEQDICTKVVFACETALTDIYSKREQLGKVYVDPRLSDYLIPFSQRSASKSYKTMVRGSKISLDETTNILRAFVYWKEAPGDRTDIDLNATLLDGDLNHIQDIAFYDLRSEEFEACHSGDITEAPEGASEFIDVNLDSFARQGGRYIVVSITSWTEQPFNTIPECFMGWMERDEIGSGEIYEPKTVIGKADLTSESKVSIPLIIDVVEKKAIWCDLALKNRAKFSNSAASNMKGITLTVKAVLDLVKPNLYDLAVLNAQARGELVDKKEDADIIFSVDEGITPYDTDKIMGQFL